MINTISTPDFDIEGFIQLDVIKTTTSGETRRRTSRIATLDGGAVINDFGYSEADRTIDLRWMPVSRAQEQAIDRLVQFYAELQVATRDGVFLAIPETYRPGADESTLRLLVLEKLSA
jgi:hypothetical protein